MYLAASLLNPEHIVQTGGILLIALIIFAETGLLLGFFLPGDTLLIAAGIYAANHPEISLWVLLPALAIAAALGYEMGYRIGHAAGPRFFKRQDGLFFKEEYVTRTKIFFERHGGKSIILARFVFVIRTVVPLVAGIGRMNRRYFHTYNIAGAILWTFTITLGAYWIGQKFKHLDKYIFYLLLIAMVLSVIAVIVSATRSKKQRTALKKGLREEINYLFRRS